MRHQSHAPYIVMPGLDPGISRRLHEIAASSPAMTTFVGVRP